MKLYRAILKTDYIEGKNYLAHGTKRAPSNVPYLIDNLWEYFRPEGFPSRRHAIYASPSIQSALDSASHGTKVDDYVVCEIIVPENVKVAHLKVIDAKYHQDIKVLQKAIMKKLNFNDLNVEYKKLYAELFLPCVDAHEFKANKAIMNLIDEIKGLSTFWQEASNTTQEESLGELFFELEVGQSYQLKKLN
jgi:hypothetical protein